MHKASKRFNYL